MEKPMPPRSANLSGNSTPTKQRKDDENMEDEEQKLKLEQEEKERAEEAKKKLEEERLEAFNALRESQEQETQSELENIKKNVADLREKNKIDPEWERYMRCDGKPDPTSTTQINTYIALTKDKRNADMNIVLEEAHLMLTLLDELKQVMKDATQTRTPEHLLLYKNTVLALQQLILQRYNDATLKLLQEATYEADSETGNLQKIIKGSHEVLMLWGNLNKNPRFKSYEFEGEKFQFELPKILAVADIAIRVLKTSFDHFSHQCSTFYPKADKPAEVSEEDVAKEEEKDQKSSEVKDPSDENADKEDANSTATPDGRKSEMSTSSNKGELKDEAEERSPEEEPDNASPEEAAPTANEEGRKDVEIELEEILDPDVVDLRQFQPLGGIYHIDLIEMPPQPKSVRGWTLTQIADKPLTSMKYPLDQPTKSSSRSPSAAPESRDGGTTPTKTPVDQQPPISITMQLPSDVMFFEEPQIALWDPADHHWKTKSIAESNFDEEKRVLSFKTSDFGVFSLSQDAHLNMPFQSWELRPKSAESALLTITGAIAEAEIEIKGDKCRLNPPVEDPPSELSHIHNRWMTVEELVEAMKRAGVNLFPESDSHKFVSIQDKAVDLNLVYDQMAVLSSGFAFSWSKWNNSAPKNQIIFQGAPFIPGEGESVPDDAWGTYLSSDDRSYLLALSEFDDLFSDVIASGCSYHCDVIHAVRHSVKRSIANFDLAVKKSRTSDSLHVETVGKLLKAVQLVTFS